MTTKKPVAVAPVAPPAPAKPNWLALEPKIKAAAAAMLALDTASFLAALNGSTSWKDALVAIIGIDLPVIVGYLKSS